MAAILFAAVGLLVCAGALYAAGGGGHGEVQDSLSPAKLKDLLWRTLNFAGLVIILVMALKKPVANGLSGRRQGIQRQFEELEARKSQAEQKYKEYEAKLAKIDDEVQALIDAAVKQGETEKQRILDDAERAAGDMKRQAEMAIQHELAEAKKRLRSDIAEQAVLVAEEIIKKNLQQQDEQKMIEDYLVKVGGMK